MRCTMLSSGISRSDGDTNLKAALIDHLATIWDQPDEGIWEVRGQPRHFTYSKIMAWVAFDRATKIGEKRAQRDELERWRQLRDQIDRDVCEKAYDPELGSFTQAYGSKRTRRFAAVNSTSWFLALHRPTRPRHD